MTLLLDTHTLLWWLGGDDLDPVARDRIGDPHRLVAVSAVSLWEASIKQALGRLRFEGSLAHEATTEGFEPLPIGFAHAELAGALPPHHRDPFDRMLVAQAQLEGLTIVTRDRVFSAYDVEVLWC